LVGRGLILFLQVILWLLAAVAVEQGALVVVELAVI
jgi:hypothetical protein